jgi:integrase
VATIRSRKRTDGTVHYQVQVRLKGHPTETASFRRKTDAKKWAQQTESAIREGRHFGTRAAKKHSLADVVTRYKRDYLDTKKTRAEQERYLDWWCERIGKLSLADLTPAVIVEHRDRLAAGMTQKGTKRAPATVNRYLEALSHPLTVASREWEWIDSNPMSKVSKLKQPSGRVRCLSDDERLRLLSACQDSDNPYLELIVILALSTGARKGEILNLRWPDIDLHRGIAILRDTKNGENRGLPITGMALDKLKEFSKVRRLDTDLLFPRSDGKKPRIFSKPWLVALQKADIHEFRFHDLRHTAASYLAMNGATLPDIAAVLGHKTLAMVQRYAHLTDSHVHGVVESMNEKIFG